MPCYTAKVEVEEEKKVEEDFSQQKTYCKLLSDLSKAFEIA